MSTLTIENILTDRYICKALEINYNPKDRIFSPKDIEKAENYINELLSYKKSENNEIRKSNQI